LFIAIERFIIMASSPRKTAKKIGKKVAKVTGDAAKKVKAKIGPRPKTPAPQVDPDSSHSLAGLQDQLEEMFDRYFRHWPGHLPRFTDPWGVDPSSEYMGFDRAPTVDMSETDQGYRITAELPGMDEENLDIDLTDNVLTIRGEKREEREEKKKAYHLKECRYGQFRRSLRLPEDVNTNKISAKFKKGVLKLDMPKTKDAKKRAHKIKVQ